MISCEKLEGAEEGDLVLVLRHLKLASDQGDGPTFMVLARMVKWHKKYAMSGDSRYMFVRDLIVLLPGSSLRSFPQMFDDISGSEYVFRKYWSPPITHELYIRDDEYVLGQEKILEKLESNPYYAAHAATIRALLAKEQATVLVK
ncbi:MAG: hypothetical protein Q7K65_02730 [Candidatus Buchananbacteria bacterium]|nr:hypothetical protein [Candidatus Buchananbacteria bacterium]